MLNSISEGAACSVPAIQPVAAVRRASSSNGEGTALASLVKEPAGKPRAFFVTERHNRHRKTSVLRLGELLHCFERTDYAQSGRRTPSIWLTVDLRSDPNRSPWHSMMGLAVPASLRVG